MDLNGVLLELLDAVGPSPVRAVDLRDRLSARASAITMSGSERKHPEWATCSHGDKDIYVELGGDVLGAHLYDDARGWGARAHLRVARGAREDLERLAGPMNPMPAMPYRPETLAATVRRPWSDVRVFADHVEGRVQSVELHYPAEPRSIALVDRELRALTWIEANPTADLLAIGCEDGSVWLWNSTHGGIVKRMRHRAHVVNARWSPDGQRLAVAERGGRLAFYDRVGELLDAVETGHETLHHATFHPSGELLATAGDAGKVIVWRTPGLVEAYRMPLETAPGVRSLAFNGQMLLVGFANGSFESYVDEGRARYGGGEVFHGAAVASIAWNPKHAVALLGGGDGSMRAIKTTGDWATVQLWRGDPPERSVVNQIAFSPDGECFIAACSDGAARLVRCYEAVAQTLGHPSSEGSTQPPCERTTNVASACFDRTRPVVYTGHFDGSFQVWGVAKGERRLTVRMDGNGCGFKPERVGPAGLWSWREAMSD